MLLHAFTAAIALTLSSPQISQAQPAAEAESIRQLAGGWQALAAGRTAEAEAAADAALRGGHARHDAVSLKVRARVAAAGAESALTAYDEWSRDTRDDVFLLQPIARAMLHSLAGSKRTDVRLEALKALAANGDTAARGALQQAGPSADGDAALASLGDAAAVTRLREHVSQPSPGYDQVAAIDALVDAKVVDAVPDLIAALDPARPSVARAAAASGLGVLSGPSAVGKLKDLLSDPDGSVSTSAALALARMGDPAGLSAVAKMESSPVVSVRLAAAEVTAAGRQSDAWVAVATDALRDPDPLTRLQAAQLLIRNGQDVPAAREVLRASLADGNPALRHLASQVVSKMPVSTTAVELAQLKHMLRDASEVTRIAAAGAILQLAGGVE